MPYKDYSKIENRRRRIAVLLCTLARPSVRRIREALAKSSDPITVGKSTIDRDIKAIRAEWREARMGDMDVYIGAELEKLRLLEEEAWAGLHNSKGSLTETTTTTRQVPVLQADGEIGMHAEITIQRKEIEQNVDPRFMRTLVDAQRRRADLLGLDAPKGLDVTSGGQAVKFTVDIGVDDWSPPELTEQDLAAAEALETAGKLES